MSPDDVVAAFKSVNVPLTVNDFEDSKGYRGKEISAPIGGGGSMSTIVLFPNEQQCKEAVNDASGYMKQYAK